LYGILRTVEYKYMGWACVYNAENKEWIWNFGVGKSLEKRPLGRQEGNGRITLQ
jgi:hypothetical protein